VSRHVLLDGHSLAYRAWFALQETGMKTASGQETQAVFGFVSMVTKLLDDLRPDGIAVAFDRPEPTFRDALVPDYKAGRAATPEPLREQIGLIRQFCDALGAPVLEAAGYEADDVIGTLAARLVEAGEDLIIVTGDRDAYQLVADPHVQVLYNRRGVTDYVLYDEAGIFERTGVRPVDYPLLAALRGDPSDNLPGVPGVGDKTAARLVNDYGDIDGIFANVAKLSPKLGASLAAAEEQVRRNFTLTPIVRDAPVELDLEAWRLRPDREELTRVLHFLEMRAPKERLFLLLDALEGEGDIAPEAVEDFAARPVRLLADTAELGMFVNEVIGDVEARSIVVEPTWAGLPGRSAIVGLAFALDGAEEVAYLPGEVIGEPAAEGPLRVLLSGRGGLGVVANRAKELMRALLPQGVDLTGLACDTAVVAYLVDPALGQDSLEDVAARRGIALGRMQPAAGGQLGFDLDPTVDDEVASETAKRAEAIGLLGKRLLAELDAIGERSLFEEVERPLVRVLAKMEVAGVAVDVELLQEINNELSFEAKELEQRVYEIAGEPFNLNSPPQLRVVLYDRLGLRPQRKTKTGYSTDAQTLEKLRDEDQSGIVDVLLRYREVEKLRSTYGSGLLAEVAPDGRIHASFNQTVARTGRLSSDAPNLHNIPVRTEGGRRFREAFIPAPGSVFLVADYNQIELRVIAHLAEDPGLVAAFAEGRDIHATTAAGIYRVEAPDVSPAMRAKAKMVSYGLAYGMEAYGLSQRLSIEVGEANEMLEQYFLAFPAVRSYMETTVAEARVRGYTETERGRRRYLPELASSNFRVRQAAERQAMNAGIQGLAADIFKIALVRLDAALEEAQLGARIVLQVHDEVVVEVPDAEREVVRVLTEQALANAYPLKVPLEAHIAFGDTWGGAKSA
jgi:DNA polymerase-1